MQYDDRVYGSTEINTPVLIDLMQSAAMQRLSGVLQHGITSLIGVTRQTSRFEHSLGVMLLVRRLGGSLQEQIAALLHDVSHTAFSHVIDYVFDGHDSQTYHEGQKESHISSSDLPGVLARHGYDWRAFLCAEDYSLLEQPAPRLCADRLDYFLRDSRDLGLATEDQVRRTLEHLIVRAGRIGVDDVELARWMGYTYIAADEASWANFREVGLYELTARAIRLGLKQGLITEADFWGTDDRLWAKLQSGNDPDLQHELDLISLETQFIWDEATPTFRLSTKLRTIDPDVLIDNQLCPLSTLDHAFAERRRDYLSRKQGKWPMRVLGAT